MAYLVDDADAGAVGTDVLPVIAGGSHFFGQSSFAGHSVVAEASVVKVDAGHDLIAALRQGVGADDAALITNVKVDPIAGSTGMRGNFVTFLENTKEYRRDLRRAEYGDERDTDMRKFLQRISPLTNVESIKKPLFVVQGANDPRVPASEAEQIARALGVPCSYFFPGDANSSIVGDDVISLVSKPSHAEALILLSKLTAPQKQTVVGLLRAMLDGQVDIADEETGSERSDRPCDAA